MLEPLKVSLTRAHRDEHPAHPVATHVLVDRAEALQQLTEPRVRRDDRLDLSHRASHGRSCHLFGHPIRFVGAVNLNMDEAVVSWASRVAIQSQGPHADGSLAGLQETEGKFPPLASQLIDKETLEPRHVPILPDRPGGTSALAAGREPRCADGGSSACQAGVDRAINREILRAVSAASGEDPFVIDSAGESMLPARAPGAALAYIMVLLAWALVGAIELVDLPNVSLGVLIVPLVEAAIWVTAIGITAYVASRVRRVGAALSVLTTLISGQTPQPGPSFSPPTPHQRSPPHQGAQVHNDPAGVAGSTWVSVHCYPASPQF